MKNFILNTSKVSEYADFWIKLDGDLKEQMKMAILATLASPSNIIRRSIAQIISAIASIEIPRGEWNDLLPMLCRNSMDTELNKDMKSASLTTLGFICEEIEPRDLSVELKDNIISSLVTNITDDKNLEELTILAITSFPNSIRYAE